MGVFRKVIKKINQKRKKESNHSKTLIEKFQENCYETISCDTEIIISYDGRLAEYEIEKFSDNQEMGFTEFEEFFEMCSQVARKNGLSRPIKVYKIHT